MRLLPEKRIGIGYDDFYYEEITQYDILKSICDKCRESDFKDIQVDASKEEGEVILTIKKEKLLYFLEEAKKKRKQYEYDMKYIALKEKVGFGAVKQLLGTQIEPEQLIKYLPSKELIEKDYELWYRLYKLSCGYYTTDEGLLSIELAKQLATGKSLDAYPEQLVYHYYEHPQQFKSVCDVPFTKTEFLESIKKRQKTKKLIKE